MADRSAFTGTGRMVRLVLRLDRLRLAIWVAGTAAVVGASAASLPAAYPDQRSIDAYGSVFGQNPALVAFAGPGYGMDRPNIGVILVNEVQLWGAITMALMSIFLVNRHTRAEEDQERAYLLRSSVLGRHASAAAVVVVVGLAQVVLAALCFGAFVAAGYGALGSAALAASLLAVGWMFVGVALVAVQVAGTGRAALGLASLVLGIAFVVRALGDVARNPLRWTSPIAWAQGVRAFAGERWDLLALCVVAAVALVALGFRLSARRDLGAGYLRQRDGATSAGPLLRHPLGMALHLHRWALVGWTASMFVLGAVYGSVGDDIERMMRDNPMYRDFIAQSGGASPADSYFVLTLVMLAIMAAGYAMNVVLHLHTEESSSRVEQLLATPLSRTTWMGSYLLLAGLGATVVVAAGGLGAGLSYSLVGGGAGQVGRMLGAALVTVPAVLVMAGLTAAVYGWWPGAAQWAWSGLAAVAVVDVLGEVLRLPAWTRDLSPFSHLPEVPAHPVSWAPLLVLVGLASALAALGLAGFRRRDVDLQ